MRRSLPLLSEPVTTLVRRWPYPAPRRQSRAAWRRCLPHSANGQGVNAAMESAMVLDRCIGRTGASAYGLIEAARRYNAQRRPEADAVAWMAGEKPLRESVRRRASITSRSVSAGSIRRRAPKSRTSRSVVRQNVSGRCGRKARWNRVALLVWAALGASSTPASAPLAEESFRARRGRGEGPPVIAPGRRRVAMRFARLPWSAVALAKAEATGVLIACRPFEVRSGTAPPSTASRARSPW